MNQVLANAFTNELEKLAITKKLVRKARDSSLSRAQALFKDPNVPKEVAEANLARVKGKLSRIQQMADRRADTATQNMMTAARGGKGTHVIPEYVRGGGARSQQTLQRNADLRGRMTGISDVAKEGIKNKNVLINPPSQGQRVMGTEGRFSRPHTTTDSRGKKTTKWIRPISNSGVKGNWPYTNPEYARAGLLKDDAGKKLLRDALAHHRAAPAHKLDVKSGMKKVDADALRRSRGQVDARGRTLEPASPGVYPRRLRKPTRTPSAVWQRNRAAS